MSTNPCNFEQKPETVAGMESFLWELQYILEGINWWGPCQSALPCHALSEGHAMPCHARAVHWQPSGFPNCRWRQICRFWEFNKLFPGNKKSYEKWEIVCFCINRKDVEVGNIFQEQMAADIHSYHRRKWDQCFAKGSVFAHFFYFLKQRESEFISVPHIQHTSWPERKKSNKTKLQMFVAETKSPTKKLPWFMYSMLVQRSKVQINGPKVFPGPASELFSCMCPLLYVWLHLLLIRLHPSDFTWCSELFCSFTWKHRTFLDSITVSLFAF